MLIDFFLQLKAKKLPVSTREFLTLLQAMQEGVAAYGIDEFYYLSRACLIKDEANYDKFDRAFGEYFQGAAGVAAPGQEIPEEWLQAAARRHLGADELARLEKLGWDKLMAQFRERLREQQGRHAGGNRWIGTGGSSPFGNGGTHPEGIRIGGDSAGNRSAVKVWALRQFRNLDDSVAIGTRNIKVALRRLRRFAREGAAEELDLDGTIIGTARNAGWLDLQLRPERHNKVKVLLFLDIGGSMDDHVRVCEELFSAARAEFKHLEHFYFHNCVYDHVWRDNARRSSDRVAVNDLLHTYGADYKLIFVGDAAMSPYELTHAGGSLEYANAEPGAVWLQRLLAAWPAAVWLNPEPERSWDYRASTQIVRDLLGPRMHPLTIAGLTAAMQQLSR